MSATHRTLWHRLLFVLPAAVVGSWIAVRAVAAPPSPIELDDPPLTVASATEIADPVLSELISRFASEARAQR